MIKRKLVGLATHEADEFNNLGRNNVVPGMRIPSEIEELRYNAVERMASEELQK